MTNDLQLLREAEWAFNFLASIGQGLEPSPKTSALLARCRDNLGRLYRARRPRGELVAVNEQGRRVGETHPRAKLRDEDIDLMFALRRSGMSVAEIARKFDVHRVHASRVLQSRARNHTTANWRRVAL